MLVEKTSWPSWRLRRKNRKTREPKVERLRLQMVERFLGARTKQKSEVQLFFVRLLSPLAFAGLPRFRLAAEGSEKGLAVGLTTSLAIGGAESTGSEVAVGFFGCSL